MTGPGLTRTAASAAVAALGWRYLLGTLRAAVAVDGTATASLVAALAPDACGEEADDHLHMDLRPRVVELSLQTRSSHTVTDTDVDLAHRISAAVAAVGRTEPSAHGHPVQLLEIAIDALDIAAIRPFWLAVLGYVAEPGDDEPDRALVDPVGRLPTIWFQQMDAARPQRNRLHFDLTVPAELAEARVAAAVAAGGTLRDDSHARAFWILADPEGNEVCVCTWQDRD